MVKLLGGGSDLNQVVSDMNSNLLDIKGEEIRKIFKDEQGTRVVVIDKDGLRTTAPGGGVDVMVATGNQVTFDSARNVFKVLLSGTLTVDYTASTGIAETSIAHGLTGVPAAQVFIDSGGLYQPTPYNASTAAGLTYVVYDWYVDATDFTCRILKYNVVGGTYASDSSVSFKYYLFQETAN